MRTATRIPRSNETTQQRLRRLLRERKGTPHHEDYIDGNPDQEMRTRGEVKLPADFKPTYATMVALGEQQVAHIKEKFGQDWSYKVSLGENGNWQMELTKNE